MTFDCKTLKAGDICLRRDAQQAEFIGISRDSKNYIFTTNSWPFSVGNNGSDHGGDELPGPRDIIAKVESQVDNTTKLVDAGPYCAATIRSVESQAEDDKLLDRVRNAINATFQITEHPSTLDYAKAAIAVMKKEGARPKFERAPTNSYEEIYGFDDGPRVRAQAEEIDKRRSHEINERVFKDYISPYDNSTSDKPDSIKPKGDSLVTKPAAICVACGKTFEQLHICNKEPKYMKMRIKDYNDPRIDTADTIVGEPRYFWREVILQLAED